MRRNLWCALTLYLFRHTAAESFLSRTQFTPPNFQCSMARSRKPTKSSSTHNLSFLASYLPTKSHISTTSPKLYPTHTSKHNILSPSRFPFSSQSTSLVLLYQRSSHIHSLHKRYSYRFFTTTTTSTKPTTRSQRLRQFFRKWKPRTADHITAMVSWALFGTTFWILAGTTFLASIILWVVNTFQSGGMYIVKKAWHPTLCHAHP